MFKYNQKTRNSLQQPPYEVAINFDKGMTVVDTSIRMVASVL